MKYQSQACHFERSEESSFFVQISGSFAMLRMTVKYVIAV